MPVWAWFVIGFLVLLALGAIVDYTNKQKRKGLTDTDEQYDVDDIKSKQHTKPFI